MIWQNLTPAQRNEQCARYMPPSEINPIRTWWLTFDGGLLAQLALEKPTIEAANAWLDYAKSNKTKWKRLIEEVPFSLKDSVSVIEVKRFARYTDTPGGAWMLAEELIAKAWRIAIEIHGETVLVMAKNERFEHVFDGKLPFCEAMGLIFLGVNKGPVSWGVEEILIEEPPSTSPPPPAPVSAELPAPTDILRAAPR